MLFLPCRLSPAGHTTYCVYTAGIIGNEFLSLMKEFPLWPVQQEMAIFQRVVERGSFAGAAEDVGLSPSAVAKLITRLEQRLGVRLINRTTRHLALTAEGEIPHQKQQKLASQVGPLS